MTTMTHRLHRSDAGSALIMIIALSGILTLLVATAFVLARQSIQIADDEGEVHGALAAAEAGLDDYIFRLNALDNYWQYGSSADGMPPPPDGNAAFEGYVPVPGGASDSEYTYRVDSSRLANERVVVLASTGRAGGRERTVTAVLKQSSFLDYVYFTDYETLVPAAYDTDEDRIWAQEHCTVHRRDGVERPQTDLPSDPQDDGCTEIYWGGADVVNGPFHTNDRFRLGGNATWTSTASNSDPAVPSYDANGFTGNFAVPGDPHYERPLTLPPSNTQLKLEADERTGGEGCLFTGPTSIRLQSDGRLRVHSPYTRRSGPGCGSWTGLNAAAQIIPIPANGVVYVQAIPADASDPNHTPHTPIPCPVGNGNGLGYPYRSDDPWPYSCREGDAFVEGTLNGRLTIGAENDVIITWHIDYAGTDDMLGLVANDYVAVYHPLTCYFRHRGTCYAYENVNAGPNHRDAWFRDARIDAAVLSVNGSFMVQTWDQGIRSSGCQSLGTLHVTGAIIQRYRGPVGTFCGTGYLKDYVYDERLQFSNPPSFIDPVESTWRGVRVSEQFGVEAADGS